MSKQQQFFNDLQAAGIQLNPSQIEAVTHVRGPLVVFAGPGSGKTTVLTCRASYMLQVAGVQPRELLIVTFTKAAAEEMQTRLSALPGVGWMRAKSCEMGTFHSIFLRIVLRHYGRVPRLLDEAEQRQLIRTILRETGQDGEEEAVSDLLTKISLCKNNLILPHQIRATKPENKEFKRMYTSYERTKQEKERWDYDDILIECYRLLYRDPQLREEYGKRYRYIMIDEFQDTNLIQYEIIKMLAAARNICIVGDDDQSIYRFRGSKVEYLLSFEKTFEDAKKVVLATNYRSTDQVISAAANLISRNKTRQPKKLIGTGRTGQLPKLMRPADERTEAVAVLQEIQQYQHQGIPLEDIAILYRSNIQSRILIDELVKSSIPFSVRDAEGDFYQRWQIRDILAYCKLAVNPDDLDSLTQIMNRPKRYIYQDSWPINASKISADKGCSTLSALQSLPGLETWQKRKLEQLMWDVRKLSGMSPREGVRYIRKQIGYDDYLEEYITQTGQAKEQIYEPLQILQELAAEHKSLVDFLTHVQKTGEVLSDAKRSKSGIQLMTFHKAKGLEFSAVFLIGLVKGMVPHRKALKEKNEPEVFEEERRLLYVGMTRAKHDLYLSVPQKYNSGKVDPSPFLHEVGLDIKARI